MKRTIQAVLVAVALAAPAFAPMAARADVTVTFDSGSVAYGYHDGYWDRTHAFHAWPTDQARTDWQTHNTTHYYDRVHTELPGGGWRDDTWWH